MSYNTSDASKISNHERRAKQQWEADEGRWRAQRQAWFTPEREREREKSVSIFTN